MDTGELSIEQSDPKVDLLQRIGQISTVAKNYMEGGRYIDDSMDPDERVISVSDVLNNVLDILIGELEQLGIEFTTPLQEMCTDLYRIGILVTLREVFDGDIFRGYMRSMSDELISQLKALVQRTLDEEYNTSELIQEIIISISNKMNSVSEAWTMLDEQVDLFSSTYRFAQHMDRVMDKFVPVAPVAEMAIDTFAKIATDMKLRQDNYSNALDALNELHRYLTPTELAFYKKTYEVDLLKHVTSLGISLNDRLEHRKNSVYNFEYYTSRKESITKKACVFLVANLWAYFGHTQIMEKIDEASNVYYLSGDVVKFLKYLANHLISSIARGVE